MGSDGRAGRKMKILENFQEFEDSTGILNSTEERESELKKFGNSFRKSGTCNNSGNRNSRIPFKRSVILGNSDIQ